MNNQNSLVISFWALQLSKMFFGLGHILLFLYLLNQVNFLLALLLAFPVVTEIWALIHTWNDPSILVHAIRWSYVFFTVAGVAGLVTFSKRMREE